VNASRWKVYDSSSFGRQAGGRAGEVKVVGIRKRWDEEDASREAGLMPRWRLGGRANHPQTACLASSLPASARPDATIPRRSHGPSAGTRHLRRQISASGAFTRPMMDWECGGATLHRRGGGVASSTRHRPAECGGHVPVGQPAEEQVARRGNMSGGDLQANTCPKHAACLSTRPSSASDITGLVASWCRGAEGTSGMGG
jgi:hypothetical protein